MGAGCTCKIMEVPQVAAGLLLLKIIAAAQQQ
jgi:hypothetical protein